jgi:hypothetical protein
MAHWLPELPRPPPVLGVEEEELFGAELEEAAELFGGAT